MVYLEIQVAINCFWIVNNSLQVLSLLSTLNEGSKVTHLDAFDFATLAIIILIYHMTPLNVI